MRKHASMPNLRVGNLLRSSNMRTRVIDTMQKELLDTFSKGGGVTNRVTWHRSSYVELSDEEDLEGGSDVEGEIHPGLAAGSSGAEQQNFSVLHAALAGAPTATAHADAALAHRAVVAARPHLDGSAPQGHSGAGGKAAAPRRSSANTGSSVHSQSAHGMNVGARMLQRQQYGSEPAMRPRRLSVVFAPTAAPAATVRSSRHTAVAMG